MLKCRDFYEICKKYGFNFFAGVPDSTFKSWMSFLEKNNDKLTNIVTVNECEAVAVCAGYHLSTGNIGVLYMQNSGFGKTVNPLTSLCDPSVYSIPMLLMIGWRGEPGVKDAPQHHKMGPMTLDLLETLDIPYDIVSSDIDELEKTLKKAKKYMQENNKPFALVVRKGVFEKLEEKPEQSAKLLSREDAIKTVMNVLDGNEVIVSTTGKTSRELFEYRSQLKKDFNHDFYNIGSMGCAQSIALGIALNVKNKVFVFDGDGSLLMQMGAMVTTGYNSPDNFYHIVFDNQAHDSTGGQPTCSDTVSFDKVALACNYKSAEIVDDKSSLEKAVKKMKTEKGPSILVVKVKKGARSNLTRPDMPPTEHKKHFMEYLHRN